MDSTQEFMFDFRLWFARNASRFEAEKADQTTDFSREINEKQKLFMVNYGIYPVIQVLRISSRFFVISFTFIRKGEVVNAAIALLDVQEVLAKYGV